MATISSGGEFRAACALTGAADRQAAGGARVARMSGSIVSGENTGGRGSKKPYGIPSAETNA